MASLMQTFPPSSALAIPSPSPSPPATLALTSLFSWKAATVRANRLIHSSYINTSFRSVSTAKPRGFTVKAFFPNPNEEPILKEALKVGVNKLILLEAILPIEAA
ncbi:uncharacterized protein LOC127255206 isoform X2 [Andrographis paniculata]|uniref:uncharacterized protein LOC127255206 isoform X2 n=1 Tax=Andrographis paniculata TaxID=175694 RepID=UPI0021E7D878|nr:uncharacterized protein LOC127255206 isoform X2 [Andrographis paniculata]